MKILDDIMSTLDYDTKIKDIRQGVFQTAAFTHRGGLASTPHENGNHHSLSPVKEAGLLMTKDVRALADMANSSSMFEAAIGMSVINSLIEVEEERCQEINAAVILEKMGEGKRVAIIGHFPFVPKIKEAAKKLWVIEKNPLEGDYAEEEAENLIPEADVVAITGMAFTNHTLENLLGLCRQGAYIMVLGGTTPLSPILFDYGVSAVSGTMVTEPEIVLHQVSQGATFRQLKGVKLLTMEK